MGKRHDKEWLFALARTMQKTTDQKASLSPKDLPMPDPPSEPSSGKPSADQNPPTILERLFVIFENNWVITVMSIVAGIVGGFVDGRWFLLFCFPLLLGVHRSGGLRGLGGISKSIIYLVILGVSAGTFWKVGVEWNQVRGKEIKELGDYIISHIPVMGKQSAGHIDMPVQEALQPKLRAMCSLPADMSACSIQCRVENSGGGAASDISIGFQGVIPYQTRLESGTETHISIKKEETLPTPNASGQVDPNVLAFSVEIPMIPPKTSLDFTLSSISSVNQQTCSYLQTSIRPEQKRRAEILRQIAAKSGERLNVDKLASLEAKGMSLFSPGYLMSPQSRKKVEFVNQSEIEASSLFDVWSNRAADTLGNLKCMMPVFAAEQSNGAPQYFYRGASMMTLIAPLGKLVKKGNGGYQIVSDPQPPEQYRCF